jgi:GNAT superfamily N-acetyltransferase
VTSQNRLDAHFVSAIAILVEHVGAEGVRADQDGTTVTSMGRGGPEFNMAMVVAPPRDAGATIAWACGLLQDRARASMVQVPQPLYDERVGSALAACGWELSEILPAMIREVPTDVPPAPPGLRIDHVTDQDLLDAHAVATAANFGAPDPLQSLGVFPVSLLADPRVVMLNGFVDDRAEPVATAVSVTIEGVAGVYAITVHPEVRRAGVGAAMTWAAMQAGAERGADLVALQATPMGRPVYARMGFRPVRDYRRYTSPPEHAGHDQVM